MISRVGDGGAARAEVAGRRSYAIKTEIRDPTVRSFDFRDRKTMYGGKKIAAGDTIHPFASENEGGPRLVARGVVASAAEMPERSGVERQTPRVSIGVRRTALARRRLGPEELKRHSAWVDGRPESELSFKFYRRATDKIVAVSEGAAAFLAAHY